MAEGQRPLQRSLGFVVAVIIHEVTCLSVSPAANHHALIRNSSHAPAVVVGRSLDVVVRVRGLGVGNVSFPLTSLTSGGGGGGGGGSWTGVARVQLGRGGAVAVLSVGTAWWSSSDGFAETCLGEENRRSSLLSANGTSSLLASPPPGVVTGGEVEAQGDGLDLSSIIAGTPRPSSSSNGGQAHADAQHLKYASVSVIRTYKDPHDGHVVYVCEVSISVREP